MGKRGPAPKRSDQRRRRNKGPAPSTAPANAARHSKPPKSGAGSSAKAWREWAAAAGYRVAPDATRAQVIATVESGAPAGDSDLHPLAQDWLDSLRESGQSRWYAPSDWAQARVVAELLSRELKRGKASAQMVSTLHSMMTDLLTTEASRRRVSIELESDTGKDDTVPADVAAMADYRAALGL